MEPIDDFDYFTEVGKGLKAAFPGARVECFSCYRDPSVQARICGAMPNCPNGAKEGCPGRCANPNGKGDHQQKTFVTCDLRGIPNVQKGCEELFKFCTTFQGKAQGACGIGGYPGGSHHFSMGPKQLNPRAWNQCASLSGKLKAHTSTFGTLRGWVETARQGVFGDRPEDRNDEEPPERDAGE